MNFNVECPSCGQDNAYFNGVECECPDCGKTWPCSVIPDDAYTNEDFSDDDY